MTTNVNSMNKLSIISTLVDAIVAFAKGRRVSGVLLLAAAALSSRVPGIGTAVSVLLRVYRRVR
ncbi:hypothetical protein [Haloprofundus halobius]|uniref:hypothetical protein n=1 Tax=Haloprofundus halobius TaxID=2876194 RepID=UPI001CD0314D|nr:hypothetical protein [Haloprofundus halobius]